MLTANRLTIHILAAVDEREMISARTKAALQEAMLAYERTNQPQC